MNEDMQNLLLAVVILIVAVGLSRLVIYLLNYAVRRYFAQTTTQLDDIVIQSIRTPLRIVIIVIGLQLALARLSFIPEDLEVLKDAFFVTYLLLVYAAVYFLLGGLAEWYGDEVVFNTDTDLDDKFLTFFRALSRIVVTIIAFIILLGH